MPNTLVHIAIQGPLNNLLNKGSNPQWLLLGCIIPDIPWIFQRIFHLAPGIDPYILRLYSLNQASLFFCFFIAAALALTTRRPVAIFMLLSLNSFLHLLLDATQIKWANGVHLLVPFSWSMLRFDWLWPEHYFYLVATMVGLLFVACYWRKITAAELEIARPTARKAAMILCLLLFYAAGPVLFFNQAMAADNHFSRTLMTASDRVGKKIELDRVFFANEDRTVRPFSGDIFTLQGRLPEQSGLISVQGYFSAAQTIQVTRYHQHNQYRALASYLGLLLIAAIWIHSLIRRKFPEPRNSPQQGALP